MSWRAPGWSLRMSRPPRSGYRASLPTFAKNPAGWQTVQPLSQIVAQARERPAQCALSLFKAMGMGAADVALGAQVLREVLARGAGRAFPHPVRVKLRAGR